MARLAILGAGFMGSALTVRTLTSIRLLGIVLIATGMLLLQAQGG